MVAIEGQVGITIHSIYTRPSRYRKELKMSLKNLTRPKWPYFEKLSWLDQYLKDSKSAGLNPLFLSKSFDGDNSSMSLDSFMKDGLCLKVTESTYI